MTQAKIQSLAEEYKRLEKLLVQERSKRDGSLAEAGYLETRMAKIELQFQQANVDILEWI